MANELTFILKFGGRAPDEKLFPHLSYSDMQGRYTVVGSTEDRFYYLKEEGHLHVAF